MPDKGKVERAIRYLRESFFVPYMTRRAGALPSLGELNDAALQWLNGVANRRHHRGIDAQPWQRWQHEAALLQPLPQLVLARPTSTAAAVRLDRSALHHPLSVYEDFAVQVAA